MANIETCPACSTSLEIEESLYDQPFECPKCRIEVMIPKPTKLPKSVKPPNTKTAPPSSLTSSALPAKVIVKDIDLSLWSMMKLLACFGCASFIFSVIGAIIYFIVRMFLGNTSG